MAARVDPQSPSRFASTAQCIRRGIEITFDTISEEIQALIAAEADLERQGVRPGSSLKTLGHEETGLRI